MLIKKYLLLSLLIITFTSTALFGFPYTLDDFRDSAWWGEAGIIKSNQDAFMRTTLSRDFMFNPIEVGIDLNLYIPLTDYSWYPDDFEVLTLRHIAYKTPGWGFTFGHLRNFTMGYGLLIDNYDSAMAGTIAYRTKKGAFHAYGSIYERVRLDVLYTGSNISGGRASYTHPDSPFLGSPVVFGITYVNDSDGVHEEIAGEMIHRDAVEGYSFDAALPIAGEFLTAYGEVARLVDQGKGMSGGVKGNFFFFNLRYRAEYRVMDPGFVPGYFRTSYEATPFDFAADAPTESTSGFLISASSSLLDEQFKAGLIFENYGGEDMILTFSGGWKKFFNTIGVLNYIVPFTGADHAVATLDIFYETGQIYDLIFHGKRVYYGEDLFNDSYWIGIQVNMENLFPGIFK